MQSNSRTIKLRQSQALLYGTDFVRVGSGLKPKYVYPSYATFQVTVAYSPDYVHITVAYNPDWILEGFDYLDRNNAPGLASIRDYVNVFNNIQTPTWTSFLEFMFEHTIFEGLLPND